MVRTVISIRGIESIVDYAVLFFAYCIVVTAAGFFRAWTAKRMGDSTAEEFGLLSLNPIHHIDFLGVVFLFLIGFGWGKFVPVNPFNIVGRFRTVKIVWAFLSDAVAHIFLAVVSLVTLASFWGFESLSRILSCVLFGSLPLGAISQIFPNTSSMVIVIALILFAAMYLSIALAVLNLIISGLALFRAFVLGGDRGTTRFDGYGIFSSIVLPILLIYTLVIPLKKLVLFVVAGIGHMLALLFGVG